MKNKLLYCQCLNRSKRSRSIVSSKHGLYIIGGLMLGLAGICSLMVIWA